MGCSLYEAEAVKGRRFPEVTAYYFREWNGFSMSFHAHTSMEIMYVLSGSCCIELPKESFILKNGEFIFLDANVLHRLVVESGSPCRMLNIEFRLADADCYFPSVGEMAMHSKLFSEFLAKRLPYLVLRDADEIFTVLKSIVRDLNNNRAESDTFIRAQITELLLRIARLSAENELINIGVADSYVNKVIRFIQFHYDCELRIEDIAREISLHPSYLQKIFKKVTGVPILEYLTRFRIEKAKMLLAGTQIPVIEISNYIGINSRQYFTFLFHKYTGNTPSKYRKMEQGQTKGQNI